jgi:hypothetical protein
MLVNLNPLIQSFVWYFACRLALAHPGLPPTHDDWRPDSFLRLDSQQDLRGGINCAPLLNRKRPVEGDPVHPQTYYISGVGSHPINFPDYRGFQSKIHSLFFLSFMLLSLRRYHRCFHITIIGQMLKPGFCPGAQT